MSRMITFAVWFMFGIGMLFMVVLPVLGFTVRYPRVFIFITLLPSAIWCFVLAWVSWREKRQHKQVN